MSIAFNLPYHYKLDARVTSKNQNLQTYYETSTGVWRTRTSQTTQSTYKIIDNLEKIVDAVNAINAGSLCSATSPTAGSVEYSITSNSVCFLVQGDNEFINKAKLHILNSYKCITAKTICVTEAEFMKIDTKFIDEMNQLCQMYQIEVIINNCKLSYTEKKTAISGSTGTPISVNIFDVSDVVHSIHMIGEDSSLAQFETCLKVLIDLCLKGYLIEAINVPIGIIPLIGGGSGSASADGKQKFASFEQIAKQCKANIYLPSLTTEPLELNIWLTAKSAAEVLVTKTMLNKLISTEGQLVTLKTTLDQNKLDLMMLHDKKELQGLMLKYSVTLQFPKFGEQTITVQGLEIAKIEECAKAINNIAARYYTLTGFSHSIMSLQQACCNYTKTCTLVANEQNYEFAITGSAKEIKSLLHTACDSCNQLNLRLELNIEQKEFISGKKNGKLLKILNQLNNVPTFKFSNNNEYNFFIDILVQQQQQQQQQQQNHVILNTIELIELELPSELRFNIPEVFHKSVIGNGGSIIQSIMKRYNVFIKFSSNYDKSTNLYCLQRESNVLIKCPRKNMLNIPLVKDEIDLLVLKYSMNEAVQQHQNVATTVSASNTTVYYNLKFRILRNHYLMLVNNNKLHLINQLEHDYNSFIDFPKSVESFGSENYLDFNIKGSETKIRSCARQLSNLLPSSYEFKFTLNDKGGKFYEQFDFEKFEEELVIPFKLLLGCEVIVNEKPLDQSAASYHQIIMSYYDNSKLTQAIESMAYWLGERGYFICNRDVMSFSPILESSVSSPIKMTNVSNMFSPLAPPAPAQFMPLQSITNYNFNSSIKSSPLKSNNNNNNLHKSLNSNLNLNYNQNYNYDYDYDSNSNSNHKYDNKYNHKYNYNYNTPSQLQSPTNKQNSYYMVSPSRQQLMAHSPVKQLASPYMPPAPPSPTRKSAAYYGYGQSPTRSSKKFGNGMDEVRYTKNFSNNHPSSMKVSILPVKFNLQPILGETNNNNIYNNA